MNDIKNSNLLVTITGLPHILENMEKKFFPSPGNVLENILLVKNIHLEQKSSE